MDHVPERNVGDRVRIMNTSSVLGEYRGRLGTVVAHDMGNPEFRQYLIKPDGEQENVWIPGSALDGAALYERTPPPSENPK